MSILGVILAGGAGRRFGGCDKGNLEIAGERLVERACRRLAPQVDRLLISAPHDYGLPVEAAADSAGGAEGPAAGLRAALDWLHRHPDAAMEAVATVPVDGPFFPLDLVDRLARNGGAAVAAAGDIVHPTYAYWPVATLEALRPLLEAPGGMALKRLADAADARTVAFSDARAFFNINRPDDLAEAEALLASR